MTTWGRRWAAREELDALCEQRLSGATLPGLWVAGTLDGLCAPCVAVVGTRAPSDEGRRRAWRLAEELGRAGVCVVSGLALGVDGAAHEGALAAGAPTIAVLGGGHDHVFPRRHRELAARIAAGGGAVVSPFAPECLPKPWQFLARNGVIAALADAVVVVEAAARSGALNTAGHAADLGVAVLAFPGDVERPKAAGCNALIRDGATLVRDCDDILAALPGRALVHSRAREGDSRRRSSRGIATSRKHESPPRLLACDTAPTRAVVTALAEGVGDPALLADRLALGSAELVSILGELEIGGRIVRGADGYALVQ